MEYLQIKWSLKSNGSSLTHWLSGTPSPNMMGIMKSPDKAQEMLGIMKCHDQDMLGIMKFHDQDTLGIMRSSDPDTFGSMNPCDTNR